MELKILPYPDERLLTTCEEVITFDSELHAVIDQMKHIMVNANGIGLAANQVGYMKRVLVMSIKIGNTLSSPLELINPKIVERSEKSAGLSEGCLSAPGLFYQVQTRAESIKVQYQDRFGQTHVGEYTGINAVCVQHEIDHLDGIFFFEKLNRQNRRDAERKLEKRRG